MRYLAGIVLATFVLALGSGPAVALATDWLDHEQARVRLIAAGGESECRAERRLRLRKNRSRRSASRGKGRPVPKPAAA